jgi:hypothetical protein
MVRHSSVIAHVLAVWAFTESPIVVAFKLARRLGDAGNTGLLIMVPVVNYIVLAVLRLGARERNPPPVSMLGLGLGRTIV